MSFVAAAIAGTGALAGGYLAGEASKDAAAAGAQGAADASAITQQSADRARRDVNALFPSAQQDFLAGQSGAFDIIGQGMTGQQQLLSQGNLQAQQTAGQGFNQVRNALMGLPVGYGQQQPLPQQTMVQQPFAPAQAQPMAQNQQGLPSSQLQGIGFPALQANPISQGDALGGGVFSNIGDQRQQQADKSFSSISNNRDLIRAIESGEIEAQGIDTGWFNKLFQGGMGDSNSIVGSLSKISPNELEDYLSKQGFNEENKKNFRDLASEVSRISGVPQRANTGATGQQAVNDKLSAIKSNRELINAIDSGVLDAKGINTGWFKKLFSGGSGGSNSVIDSLSKISPEKLEGYLSSKGFNDENKRNFRALASEIARLSGR